MLEERRCGILMPVFSLPSGYGIGDLGEGAYRFADFLRGSGQSVWQILPLNPTSLAYGNSPYSSGSAFAGNHLLINPDGLLEMGLLDKSDLDINPGFSDHEVEYEKVVRFKIDLLERAYRRFSGNKFRDEFEKFCSEQSYWLDDYAQYIALKGINGDKAWQDWPKELRDRNPEALIKAARIHSTQIEREKFYQFIFYRQWNSLKGYCNDLGIRILGDLPIYVSSDSADTWGHQDMFFLGPDKRPELVSGVPPDYFSANGQLWGMPTYNWQKLRDDGFDWWLRRLEHTLTLFDCVRIDHFRGLVAYWEIPSTETTAVNGKWEPVPHEEFFGSVIDRVGNSRIIAEDLGIITDDVREVMAKYGFPGMKILQFAFGDDDPDHPYLPHNYDFDFVVYTGSHDNNTTRGWFENEAEDAGRQRLQRYLGREVTAGSAHWEMIRMAYRSVARWAVIPMQDALGFGSEARMNNPSTGLGNWRWRLPASSILEEVSNRLHELATIYGRTARIIN